MNASTVSALLAQRAEAVCRKYLPHGKKQGRYWCAGDARGARGRSLFVRLSPPGTPGKWTDAATGEHGDLLDLVQLASGAPTLREALAEARRFLAQPATAPRNPDRDTYDHTAAARNLWDRCGPIDGSHAETYLKARAIHRCRFPALRFHPTLAFRPDAGGWRRGHRRRRRPVRRAPHLARSGPARPRPACRVRARRLDASTGWPCGSAKHERPASATHRNKP